MTCLYRACSALEKNPWYRSDDYLAPVLLPSFLKTLIRFSFFRRFFSRIAASAGIYEYVVARTNYIDAAFHKALTDNIGQILIFGSGFDTRALRFADLLQSARVFELDAPVTQQAKLAQYHKRGLSLPPQLTCVPIDFDRESLPERLARAGVSREMPSLFILEGLLMYLQPSSVEATLQTISHYATRRSRVVFDYVHARVLRGESLLYGEGRIIKTVANVGERWHFGIEEGGIKPFLAQFGLSLIDHKNAVDVERDFFTDSNGWLVARINGSHALVTAEK